MQRTAKTYPNETDSNNNQPRKAFAILHIFQKKRKIIFGNDKSHRVNIDYTRAQGEKESAA